MSELTGSHCTCGYDPVAVRQLEDERTSWARVRTINLLLFVGGSLVLAAMPAVSLALGILLGGSLLCVATASSVWTGFRLRGLTRRILDAKRPPQLPVARLR